MRRLLIFAVLAPMFLILSATAAQAGQWITSCAYSHSAIADPIVMPMHLHDFVGATTTDTDSTFQSLLSGGTTCHTNGDHAAYWVPRMSVGVPQAGQDKDMLAYYLQGSASDVRPFPSGFRMILGNAHATSVADNPDLAAGHIYWKCGPGSAAHQSRPPSSCPRGSFLVTVFQFPQFWSGQQHAGNEIDEMSYRQDSAHPIALPKLVLYFRNSQATGNFGSVTLSSGQYYTEHADYFDAWDPSSIAGLVDRCINGGRDCGVDPAA